MNWIDTHAHLDDLRFGGDLELVLQRAVESGVAQIISVGADLVSSRAAVALAERKPRISATVGVHPHNAEGLDQSRLAELRRLAESAQVVAVGEIGLDYYRDLSPRAIQLRAFRAQLGLATDLGKPVVVHIRDERGVLTAYRDALSVLDRWVASRSALPGPPGVLHCYSGDLAVARNALEMGFYLGVDGPVTYPNARKLQALVAQVPAERLLLETDCPYLAPQAHRGRRNEPAYLPHIGHKVAEIQGVTADVIAAVTTQSARALFGLPAVPGEE